MSFSKIASPPGRVRTRLITALRCLGTLVALHAGSGRATVALPPVSAGIRVAEALTIAQASPVPAGAGTPATSAAVDTVSGMPPVIDPRNLYSETGVGRLNPATAGALSRVYVPNRQ